MFSIVENVRTSSDIVLVTSRGLQLPYRKKKTIFLLDMSKSGIFQYFLVGVRGGTQTGYDIPARWDGVWLGWEILPPPPSSSPPKMCVLLETVSFAIGSKVRDLGARLPPFRSCGRCASSLKVVC